MKENCVNLEVVLANGKVIETAGHGARPRCRFCIKEHHLMLLFGIGRHLLGIISPSFFSAVREPLE